MIIRIRKIITIKLLPIINNSNNDNTGNPF